MGGSGFSREKFNAREEYITSDNNRTQSLVSRDAQNVMADASTDGAGLPITALSGPCSLAGIVGQFNMALGAQQAFCWNPSDSSLTADDSAYEVARWVAQNILFANPSGNPRIDLVVVTPAMVDTDNQSRTILLDPVARTTGPQNVFKTTNPAATVAVVTGTPGATPAPPAVPAGAYAVFEVYVPTGAPDSTAFSVVPRMFRRAPFPWSTLSGIVCGFRPIWDLSVDPTTTASTISFGALDDCRVAIDGEVLQTLGAVLGATVTQDAGGNNPFAAPASATWHKPYYLYAVGGRHAPQAAPGNASPIIIIESLVAPVPTTGHPVAAITTPRGTTTQLGAVYIGLGFVAAGTSRRLACVQDTEFTNLTAVSALGVNVLSHVAGSSSFEAYDVHAPPVVPAVSTLAKAQIFPGSTVTAGVFVAPDNGAGTGPVPGYSQTGLAQSIPSAITVAGPVQITASGVIALNPGAPKFWVSTSAGAGTTFLLLLAFEHKVRRLRY